MKLSGRETFMLLLLFLILLIAGYWFFFFTPIQNELNANEQEYNVIRSQYDSEIAIINDVDNLKANLELLKIQVTDYENRLLPELDPEVFTAHFAKILSDNGFTKITDISCSLPMYEQLQKSDGTFSANSVQWLTVNLKASGTDGVTPGGTDKIGYDQFMKAVKQIESANPNAIHVSSITMEETNQGFQYFLVSVDVFAFILPNRISVADMNEPYVTWSRDPDAVGGIFGRPYDSIPVSQIQAGFFRPFSSDFSGISTGIGTTPTPTPMPTPTP